MKYLFLVLFLIPGVSSAAIQASTKSNKIYTATVTTDWKWVQPDPDNRKSDYNSGKVEIRITNNTNIPLTFSLITVRHECRMNLTSNKSFEPEWVTYQHSFENYELRPGKTESKFVRDYKTNGPCSGDFEGVVRSEIIKVDFVQFGVKTAFDQNMKCGDDYVPVVWTMAPDLETYFIFTDTKFLKYKFKYITDRKGENPLPVVDGTAANLKRDICNNRVSDEATKARWRAYFIHYIKKWGSACSKPELKDKCKKTYEKKHKGWSEGSIGVRG